jgi:hypothetical protein
MSRTTSLHVTVMAAHDVASGAQEIVPEKNVRTGGVDCNSLGWDAGDCISGLYLWCDRWLGCRIRANDIGVIHMSLEQCGGVDIPEYLVGKDFVRDCLHAGCGHVFFPFHCITDAWFTVGKSRSDSAQMDVRR